LAYVIDADAVMMHREDMQVVLNGRWKNYYAHWGNWLVVYVISTGGMDTRR
jgi:hypothetical protein